MPEAKGTAAKDEQLQAGLFISIVAKLTNVFVLRDASVN